MVCNEKPELTSHFQNVEYLIVNFPVPENTFDSKMNDKHRKICAGLLRAQELNATHVLITDADDCVSNRLVECVDRYPDSNGWYIKRGYVYREGTNYVFLNRHTFYQWTGTANIVRIDLLNLVDSTEANDRNYTVLNIPHPKMPKVMAARGTPLQPLPFPGAVYVIGHSENLHNDMTGTNQPLTPSKLIETSAPLFKRMILNYRLKITIQHEFNLYKLPIDYS